jgi:hypothetical protein
MPKPLKTDVLLCIEESGRIDMFCGCSDVDFGARSKLAEELLLVMSPETRCIDVVDNYVDMFSVLDVLKLLKKYVYT